MEAFKKVTALLILLSINSVCFSQYTFEGKQWDIKTSIKMRAVTYIEFEEDQPFSFKIIDSKLTINSITEKEIYTFDTVGSRIGKIADTLFLKYDSKSTYVSPLKHIKIQPNQYYIIYIITNPAKLVHLRFDTVTNELVLKDNDKLSNTDNYRFEIDSVNTLTYKVLLSWNSLSLTSSTPPILATLFPTLPTFGGNAPLNRYAPHEVIEEKATNIHLGKIKKNTPSPKPIDYLPYYNDAVREYTALRQVDSDYNRLDTLILLNHSLTRDSLIKLCKVASNLLYDIQQRFNQGTSEDLILNEIENYRVAFKKNMDSLIKYNYNASNTAVFNKLQDYKGKKLDYNAEISLIYRFGDQTFQDAEIALHDYQQMVNLGKESTLLINYITSKKNNVSACKEIAGDVKIKMEKTLELPSKVDNKDSAIAYATYCVRDFFARYSTFLIWAKGTRTAGNDNVLETYLTNLEFYNQFVIQNKDTLSKIISFAYSVDKADNKVQSPSFKSLTDVTELYVNIIDQTQKDTFKFKIPFYNYRGPFWKSLKFDFTTGLFYNNLYSKTYYLVPAPTPSTNTTTTTNSAVTTTTVTTTNTVTATTSTVTTTSSTANATATTNSTTPGSIGTNHALPFNLSIGALMNVTYRVAPDIKVGVSFGVSLSFLDATTQYMVGGCIVFRKLQQFCFSGGACFGNQTLLSSDVSSNGRTPNSSIPAGISAVPTYTKFSFGWYACVTYNIYTIP